jgi:transposase
MSMKPSPLPEPDPQIAASIQAKYYGKRKVPVPLAVAIRDKMGDGWLADEDFAALYGKRGRPGYSPLVLALVTTLQFAEDLTDRGAAVKIADSEAWRYLLGLQPGDPGPDHSVLPEFRAKLAEGGAERAVFDAQLAWLKKEGLVKAGGKQRADSTGVIAAVASLTRLELAGEAVRAALEALAAAHPAWTASVLDEGWLRRYGTPVTSWKPPMGEKKRAELALAYGKDGYALLSAVDDPGSPHWLREIPAVAVLRTVLDQNYLKAAGEDGTEVITRREKGPSFEDGGLPPADTRIASPYDLDARWGSKRNEFWLGYKLHVTETCDDRPPCGCGGTCGKGCAAAAFPNLVTDVATTPSTVNDVEMTAVIDDHLAAAGLLPARLYEDSGYLSTELLVSERRRRGVTLVGPLLRDTSAQARAGNGYARADFAVDYDAGKVTCPQGKTSSAWSPCTQNGKAKIVAAFSARDCGPCPARGLCLTGKTSTRRQMSLDPRDLAEAQAANREQEKTRSFAADYARRAGIEGTMNQAVRHGARRARYRGLPKVRLEHAFMAAALNFIRLHAYWTGTPLNRGNITHLARLDLDLAV